MFFFFCITDITISLIPPDFGQFLSILTPSLQSFKILFYYVSSFPFPLHNCLCVFFFVSSQGMPQTLLTPYVTSDWCKVKFLLKFLVVFHSQLICPYISSWPACHYSFFSRKFLSHTRCHPYFTSTS